jgi:uncharacterized protein YhaN
MNRANEVLFEQGYKATTNNRMELRACIHALEYIRDRSPLPVVMDDILVNADPSRVTAAIETLVRISEQFQILYFHVPPGNCHEVSQR